MEREIDFFKTAMVYVIIFIILYLAFSFIVGSFYLPNKSIRAIFMTIYFGGCMATIFAFAEGDLPFYKKTKEEKIEKYKAKAGELQEELQILGEVHELQKKIYNFKQK